MQKVVVDAVIAFQWKGILRINIFYICHHRLEEKVFTCLISMLASRAWFVTFEAFMTSDLLTMRGLLSGDFFSKQFIKYVAGNFFSCVAQYDDDHYGNGHRCIPNRNVFVDFSLPLCRGMCGAQVVDAACESIKATSDLTLDRKQFLAISGDFGLKVS